MNNELILALQNTMSADATLRKNAEQYLLNNQQVAGFCTSLLTVAADSSIQPELKLAAAVQFKNTVRRFWKRPEPDSYGIQLVDPNQYEMSASEKNHIRQPLLHTAVTSTTSSLHLTLTEAIAKISRSDFPAQWPDLLPQLASHLQNNEGDMRRMVRAASTLRSIAKTFEFSRGDRRVPAAQLAEQMLPLMLQMTTQLLNQNINFDEAGDLIRLSIKLLYSLCRLELPTILRDPTGQLSGWLDSMNRVLLKDVSGAPGRPTNPEELSEWSWWKAKKHVLKTWQLLFQRYGNPHYVDPEIVQFATFWSSQIAHQLLGTVMQVLTWKPNGRFCSNRCMMLGLRFLSTSIELGSTFRVIAPHLDSLLRNVIFPVMYFTQADMQLWNEDPQEYVRKSYSIQEEYLDPRDAARTFLSDMAARRPWKLFPVLMPFIGSSLTEYAAQSDDKKPYHKKEGIMTVIGHLHEYMKERTGICEQLESLMMTHILPEFNSPHGFLRARACWVTRFFTEIEWTSEVNRKIHVERVVQCLKDKDFPVRVEAATSLRFIIEDSSKEQLAPFLPIVPQLLETYFSLMNEMGISDVIEALQVIIGAFGDQVAPHAVTIVSSLTQAFQKYAMATEDEESAFAAMNCLDSISALLSAMAGDDKDDDDDDDENSTQTTSSSTLTAEQNAQLYLSLEPQCIPLIVWVLNSNNESGIEYLENALTLLGLLSFHGPPGPFTSAMWTGFTATYSAFMDFAFDYIEDVSIPLMNFVERDMGTFLSGGSNELQLSYPQMYFNIVGKVFGYENAGRQNTIIASQMLLCLLHWGRGPTWPNPPPSPLPPGIGQSGGKVDAWLQPSLTLALQRLQTAKNGALKVALLQVIESCIVYDAATTLQLLEQAGVTQHVFTMWLQPGVLAGHEESRSKRLCALAFMCILRLPSNSVPLSIKSGMNQLFVKAIEMLSNLEQQRSDEGEDLSFWQIDENGGEEEDDDSEEEDDDSDEEEEEEEVAVADDADIVSEEDIAYLESLNQMKKEQEDRKVSGSFFCYLTDNGI
jgi:hypothetical protein